MSLAPTLLPDLTAIRLRAQALAMLDAILSPEWEYRYFSFDPQWGTGAMASWRNGSGDEWFLEFGSFGAAIKGLAHESDLARDAGFPAAVRGQVPAAFGSFLDEPAYSWDHASFCYWRASDDAGWQRAVHPDPALADKDDGADEMLALLIEPAAAYVEFAAEYYEVELPLEAVERLYAHAPLSDALVQALNPEVTLAQVREFADEIGYPALL